jgi:hypothetical protein
MPMILRSAHGGEYCPRLWTVEWLSRRPIVGSCAAGRHQPQVGNSNSWSDDGFAPAIDQAKSLGDEITGCSTAASARIYQWPRTYMDGLTDLGPLGPDGM